MGTKYSKIWIGRAMHLAVIFAILLSVSTVVYAAAPSPFVGHWQAVDVDGSDIRLTIAGPPSGAYQITWTDSYISFCGGEAGIVRGTGWFDEANPNILEADLHLECFTTGNSTDFHMTWRYHPATNTLSSRYENNSTVIIWNRPGMLASPPPELSLRVNYGHDWVESFYEPGHVVWVVVTDPDGGVRATTETVTEEKDYWADWEGTGFQTNDSIWFNGEGDQIENPPDIQPNDWVYAWVDNGASAQVQIGDISGVIELADDSVNGTVYAPWFSEELDIDCHSWGAPLPEEILRYDTVIPDGEDTYFCSWAGDWDIQPGQDVGVGYSGSDGNWVANVFLIPLPSFAAYMPGAIEGYDWPMGDTIHLDINDGEYSADATSEQRPDFPEGETRVLFELPMDEFSMEADDHILMTDEALGFTKELYIADLQVADVNIENQTVSGFYEPVYPDFWIWLDGQEPLDVQFNENAWVATFAEMVPGSWGTVAQDDWDHDGTVWDFYVPNTRFTVWPEWNYLEGYEWPEGEDVSISVAGKGECSAGPVPGFSEGEPWNTFFSVNFPEACTIEAEDVITLSSDSLALTHQVPELAITDVDLDFNTVAGTAVFDPEQYIIHTWIHDVEESYMQLTAEGGTWLADFGSQGFYLQPGMGGRVEVVDQASNATAVDWWIPSPRFSVFPEWEYVEGWDWPEGEPVTATVAGKSECIASGDSGHPEWDPNALFVGLWFPEVCDIVVNDIVTVTDGVTSRTYEVQDLAITEVNKDASTVSGTAFPGALVYTWVHEYGYDMELSAGDGTWLADFRLAGLDLVEGMGGRVEVRDTFGNATAVDWWIPNPRFTVFPEWEWFDGYDWPDGATVSITVAGKSECDTTSQESWGGFFNGGFPGSCDIAVDDSVTFTYGEITRNHTVRNVAITEVNKEAGTVSGTADADLVYAWVHEYGYDMVLPVEDGNWFADFGSAGLLPFVEGMGGRTEVRDEFGNSTAADWYIPTPRIVVQISDDWFRAENFTPNAELTFWVYESEGGELLRHPEGTWPLDDSGYVTVGMWELEEYIDLVPGNYVVVSDGEVTKELTLEDFTFDVFDLANGHLQGTAPEPFDRPVWVGIGFENDAWTMDITTGGDGSWLADFGQPVPGDYQWVAAQVFDDDGDASELRPASQVIFLRPSCGDTYNVQANIPLELRYGSWAAIGESLAIQNAEHLTVNLVLDGEPVAGVQQPVIPASEFPCGSPPEDAYGVYYVAQVDALSPGTYVAEVTWIFDEAVTDGYDADGNGEPDWYEGEFTREFTIVVP